MGRAASLAFFCLSFVAAPAIAECGMADPSDGVSKEAMHIINNRYLRRIEANKRIDRETSQQLLGRMFDLKTGKPKNLTPVLLEQYRRDARYFADLLRQEANKAEAQADAAFAKLSHPCPVRNP